MNSVDLQDVKEHALPTYPQHQLVGDEDDVYIFTACLGEMLRESLFKMFKEKDDGKDNL